MFSPDELISILSVGYKLCENQGYCSKIGLQRPIHAIYIICISVPRRLFYTALQWTSRRLRSQNISKEQALIPEKDSTRKRPRSHVSLEKISKNYKPLKYWANQTSSLTSLHSRPTILATQFGGFATWWSQNCEKFLPFSPAKLTGQTQGRGRGDSRFDLAH